MIKVILPLRLIPLGSKVYKVGGSKIYTTADRIILYDLNGEMHSIFSEHGTKILIANDGNANSVNWETEYVWPTDYLTLMDYCGSMYDDTD